MTRKALLVLISFLLAGCAVDHHDIGRDPRMTQVGAGLSNPIAGTANLEHTSLKHAPRPPIGNSFWQDASADLFRDGRARHNGDVVTVRIQINDKASLDNTSNRSRDSKTGLGVGLDYSIVASGGTALSGDTEMDGSLNSNTSTKGGGAISRSESIDLRIAAVVTGVLPNGNLLIRGTQEVRVNYEVRVLTVAGVVRPEDITSANAVSYDKIAEARITYGGRGRLSEVQQPALGQQILDIVTPF